MSDLKAVGTNVIRADGLEKVTGAAKFGADLRPADRLHGKLFRSTLPHARILSIDISKAKRLTGVKAVLTAADTCQVAFGFGPFRRDKHIFAVDKVRYLGDELAAVAAVDEEVAQEALELISVDYDPLPAVFDPEEAMKPGAPRIHEELENNLVEQFVISRGDIAQGFKEADLVLEETFRTPRQHQCYLEPVACLVCPDLNGNVTIYGPFKDIFTVRAGVARTLGLSQGKVRAVQLHVGGGFGAKGGHHISLWAGASLLALKTGRPVLMENSREEEFLAGRPRVPSIIKIRLGVTTAGKMVAKQSHIIAEAGAYTGPTPLITETMARRADNIYKLTSVKNEAYLVLTNRLPTGAFRGFGNPQTTFALESMIDMAAQGLFLDPAELRLKNATKEGDTTVHGWQPRSCGLTQCINLVTEAARWKEKKERKRANTGLGLACMIHVSGRRQSPNFYGSRCLIKIGEDGKAHIISGEGEVGQGWYTVATLIAAEELGVPVENVKMVMPDTQFSPHCFGPFSDRTTILGGNAVRMAAAEAKRKLLMIAAKMLEADPGDMAAEDGKLFVKGSPDKGLTIGEVARQALEQPGGKAIWGVADYDPPSVFPDPITRYGNVSTSYTFAAQVAEVEVDPETGKVTILNFLGAHDLGKALYPMGAEGQIQGAASQGIGFALLEEIKMVNGFPINPDFLNYRIATAVDVPPIRPMLVESNDPYGPFGAKGVAEPGLVPTAPAIANAIFDAVGVRLTTLPITPENILCALEEKVSSSQPEEEGEK